MKLCDRQKLLGSGEISRDHVPIDDVPEGRNVVRATILVVQVISVLPNIESEDRSAIANSGFLAHERVVLIRGGANSKASISLYAEPSPARSETSGARFGKFFFKSIERSKGGIDGSGKITRGCARSAGSNHLPKKAVIEVTATIVAKRSNPSDLSLKFLEGEISEFGVPFEGSI